jgi:hypothetical protein
MNAGKVKGFVGKANYPASVAESDGLGTVASVCLHPGGLV